MQRLRSITIGYALVALCCFGQPVPESRAENRAVSEGVIAGAESAAAGSPITVGIRLAQSGKKEQAQGGSENWKRMGETVVSGTAEVIAPRNRVSSRFTTNAGASATSNISSSIRGR